MVKTKTFFHLNCTDTYGKLPFRSIYFIDLPFFTVLTPMNMAIAMSFT